MEIRRSYERLISTMGFPTLVRRHLYIESGPCCLFKRTAQETTTDRQSPRVAQSRRPVAYFMARAPMQVPHHGLWSIAALKMNLGYASKSEEINFNPPGADVQLRLTHSLSRMLSVKLKYKNFHGIRKYLLQINIYFRKWKTVKRRGLFIIMYGDHNNWLSIQHTRTW